MCSFHRQAMDRSCAWLLVSAWLVNLTWAGAANANTNVNPTLQIDVDACDLPRRLLHTRIRFMCPANRESWLSGFRNGFRRVTGPTARSRTWGVFGSKPPRERRCRGARDESEPYRIECNIPDGRDEIRLWLDTICNQPAALSLGYLSYGNIAVGIINWGTCLVYPEGYSCGDIQVHLSLRLPNAWRYATAQNRENQ